MKLCTRCQKRRLWMKVWDRWWTTRSHEDLDGVALAVGLAAMSIANGLWAEADCLCQKRHGDGHGDGANGAIPRHGDGHGDAVGDGDRDVVWLVTATGEAKSVETIARRARFTVEQTRDALQALVDCGTMERRADGVLGFPRLIEYQEAESKKRTRTWRARQQSAGLVAKRHGDGHGDVVRDGHGDAQRPEARVFKTPLPPRAGDRIVSIVRTPDPEPANDRDPEEPTPPPVPPPTPPRLDEGDHKGTDTATASVLAAPPAQPALPVAADPLDGALREALAPLPGEAGWTRTGALRNRNRTAADLARAAAIASQDPAATPGARGVLSALLHLREAYPLEPFGALTAIGYVHALAGVDARDLAAAVAQLVAPAGLLTPGVRSHALATHPRAPRFPALGEIRACVDAARVRRELAERIAADKAKGDAAVAASTQEIDETRRALATPGGLWSLVEQHRRSSRGESAQGVA